MSDPTPPLLLYVRVRPPSGSLRRRTVTQSALLAAPPALARDHLATTLIVGAQVRTTFVIGLPALPSATATCPCFTRSGCWHPRRTCCWEFPSPPRLMGILLAHEMGHFIVCAKKGVYATLPFFIPAPTLLGTFGAFIRIKSPHSLAAGAVRYWHRRPDRGIRRRRCQS